MALIVQDYPRKNSCHVLQQPNKATTHWNGVTVFSPRLARELWHDSRAFYRLLVVASSSYGLFCQSLDPQSFKAMPKVLYLYSFPQLVLTVIIAKIGEEYSYVCSTRPIYAFKVKHSRLKN